MYCSICGGPVVATCTACERHICRQHRRRWLGLTLCTRCHARTAPTWAVVLALGLAGTALALMIVK